MCVRLSLVLFVRSQGLARQVLVEPCSG